MTKRAVIITSSVIVSLIVVVAILFGAVFRVRNIDLVCAKDFKYIEQQNEILSTSKIKKNISIFNINRNKVVDRIEKTYPYARVNGVNLTFNSVKITLSNRAPLYYFAENEVCYILDEDCKVLEKMTLEQYNASGQKYILLSNVFSAGDSVEVGEFLSNKYTQVCNNLYSAIYTNAVLNIGEDADLDGENDEKYLDREDMCKVVNNIKFDTQYELNGQMDKLIITTSYGCKISIIQPQKDLDLKINMAFSALRTLISNDKLEGTDLATKGTIAIRYSYDANNNISTVTEYHA